MTSTEPQPPQTISEATHFDKMRRVWQRLKSRLRTLSDFSSQSLKAWPVILFSALAGFVLFGNGQAKDLFLRAQISIWARLELALALYLLIFVGTFCFILLRHEESKLDGQEDVVIRVIMALVPIIFFIEYCLLPDFFSLWGYLLLGLSNLVTYALALILPLVLYPIMLRKLDKIAFVPPLSLMAMGLFPATLGDILGSSLILALGWSCWLALVSTVVITVRRGNWDWTLPFTLLLCLHIAGCTVANFGLDQRRDRIRGEERFQTKPSLREVFEGWRKQSAQGEAGSESTIVLVAAAGGGVRASYWTSLLLAHATDRAPMLRHRMFLASGVSGGSLGLSLYRALAEIDNPRCGERSQGTLEECAQSFHRHDLLAGVLAASLTDKIFNIAFPVIPQGRSRALEGTWEKAWRTTVNRHGGDNNSFAEAMDSLWRTPGKGFSLVLNTTSSTGGDRVPISNLHTDDWLQARGPCSVNIAEHLQLPLSTAANASARFPGLEDWGWFSPARGSPGSHSCNEQEAVADGGFTENYGAATIANALDKLLEVSPSLGKQSPRLIVVQITSDPECKISAALDPGTHNAQSCEAKLLQMRRSAAFPFDVLLSMTKHFVKSIVFFDFIHARFWKNYAFDLRKLYGRYREWLFFSDPEDDRDPGILGVLENSRTVNGLDAATILRAKVKALGGSYYHFSMTGAFRNPLGWSLSETAREELNQHLGTGCAGAMRDFIRELNTGEPPQTTGCEVDSY